MLNINSPNICKFEIFVTDNMGGLSTRDTYLLELKI